jgi:hypothetical protein
MAKKVEGERSTRSERLDERGERLDAVLQKLREAGGPGATAATDEFASILGSAGVDEKAQNTNSLEVEIVDFTIPRITEPTIFHPSQSISLLEHFLNDLLPTLGESEELNGLAVRVISDEISRQREVLDRLQAGIAA